MASKAVKSVTSKWQKAATAFDSAAIAVEQEWADLEHSAEEAVKAGNAADIPALVAQAVRKARPEFDHMATALSKTAAEAATGGGSTATAQAPMDVDAAERKRPLDEGSKSKTDDDEDELQPARQARRQEPASSVNETDRERSRSPR